MKKLLFPFLATAMITVSHTATAQGQAAGDDSPTIASSSGNRIFYGFNLGSAEWADENGKTYDCGFVSYPFDLSEKGTVHRSYLSEPTVDAFAGCGKDGILYAALYEYTQAPTPTDFVAYNTYNGVLEIVGKWNPEKSNFKPQDMTYDPVSGKIYAMGFGDGDGGLYEVDVTTATFTKVCSTNVGGLIAADAKGTLWVMNSSGMLYTLATDENGNFTGRGIPVCDTGLEGMLFNQTMEFDHTTGLLYWASCTYTHPLGAENVYLQELNVSDIENVTIKEVGRVGILSRLVGMYIPSAESLDAPAAPTNIRSTPGENGTLEAHLTWMNPTISFGGGEIGNLYGVAISRNGKRVDYIEGPVSGKEMSWTDKNIPEPGNYRYDIQIINGKGNGAKGIAYQYVGHDRPAAVKNINTTIGNEMKSLTLTWEAPAEGARLGSFDPSKTTYTVTRNDGTVIAENITECTVTDKKFARLAAWTYTVTASNDYGHTDAFSKPNILGPAVKLPFEQTFENEAEVRNRWTVLDANTDTYSWMFYTNLGHSIFGDYEVCAEYIVSPTLGNAADADEWLISPPLAFEADTEYEVTISGRCFSIDANRNSVDELIDVHFGEMNTIEAMGDKLGTLKVSVNGPDEATGTMAFKRTSQALPVLDEDATRCVGLHLVTPMMLSGFLQLNGIYIGEKGEYNGVADIATDTAAATFSLNGHTLTIFGHFGSAAIYNLQGTKVATATSAIVDLSGLTSGIYILSVDGRSFKIAI